MKSSCLLKKTVTTSGHNMKIKTKVKILEENSFEIEVDEKDAAKLIRGWFCTTGLSVSATAVVKKYNLNERYEWPTISSLKVDYKKLPKKKKRECYEDYSLRLTKAVNKLVAKQVKGIDKVNLTAFIIPPSPPLPIFGEAAL